ncbi:MAG TPA: nitrilase-related carbon-nitrogen hydrolase [Kofleriaceae bacterium]|nr:nitrilase-related carbon-nitrogen hydrolase [Kofleriaceae bacterium]
MNVELVAIQLAVDAEAIASADAYRRHLEAAAATALDSGGSDARLVVFPEVAGHLALYALAPPRARKAKTLASALAQAAVRRPLDVLRGVVSTRLLDARHAVLAAIAPDGERWWKALFGPLARQYNAYVVAGSFLRLHADGSITNSSHLFGPDGSLLATTDKVNLLPGVEDGAPGGLALHRGDSHVPIVQTPFGKLATLIGYDACREPQTTQERFVALGPRLTERGGVDIVANPSANPLGKETPGDELARYVVTAHLVCKVLDLAFEGSSEIRGAETSRRGGHVVARVSC